MKQKLIIIVLSMTTLGLGANIFRMSKQHKEEIEKLNENPEAERLGQLEAEKQSWSARESDLLRQNGELVVKVNELTMQLNKKPQTIYITKNENTTIDKSASDEFNRILTGRYSN